MVSSVDELGSLTESRGTLWCQRTAAAACPRSRFNPVPRTEKPSISTQPTGRWIDHHIESGLALRSKLRLGLVGAGEYFGGNSLR